MNTYDEYGNIISDTGFENNVNSGKTNHTTEGTEAYNDINEQPHSMQANVINPEFEQARQITAKAFARKGHPIIGAVLTAGAYGLELLLANDNKMSSFFDFDSTKGGAQ